MKSILDPSFRYVPSSKTDISKTFARVRREIAAQAEANKKPKNVKPLRKAA